MIRGWAIIYSLGSYEIPFFEYWLKQDSMLNLIVLGHEEGIKFLDNLTRLPLHVRKSTEIKSQDGN
jgi:hypothetical protein